MNFDDAFSAAPAVALTPAPVKSFSIGFTGTRNGMTDAQKAALAQHLRQFSNAFGLYHEFHHGACVGADEQAVQIAHGIVVAIYTAHPGDLPAYTSQIALELSGDVRAVKPTLDRNRDIVDACEILFACPSGPEELRSGTWATIRYARRQKKRIVIIWPNGDSEDENL